MPRLTITIEEKIEELPDDKKLYGYSIHITGNFEGVKRSSLPALAPLCFAAINHAAKLLHETRPEYEEFSLEGSNSSLESVMAKVMAKLDKFSFPTEL